MSVRAYIWHPLRPEGQRFPRHRAAGLGCSRFVAVSMTAPGCANQPLLLFRHMGFGGTSYCTLSSTTERGAFCMESGNPDIVRLVGRVDRLGCVLIRHLVS